MSDRGEVIAIAVGQLLRRDVRQNVYARLTDGVADGVNEATYPILSGLDRYGPSTAAEIGALVGLDRSVVSRHATALESAGLLGRETDQRDRRWTALTLTDKGAEAVSTMRERLTTLIDDFLEDWPGEQAESFATILTAFTTNGPFTG